MSRSIIHKSRSVTSSLLRGAAAAALALAAAPAISRGPPPKASQFLPLKEEAPAKLYVDAPAAEPLARGVAVVPYRLENFRILPVFGAAAKAVSPRVGHLHVTVDNLPWHWADAGNTESIVVADLSPGPHSLLIELALPDHKVIAGQRVHFVVPEAPHGGGYGTAGHR